MNDLIKIDKKEFDTISEERIDWGYDALCLRFEQLANELVYYKTYSQEAKDEGYYGDFKYYKRFYNNRSIRFFEELGRFLNHNFNEKKNKEKLYKKQIRPYILPPCIISPNPTPIPLTDWYDEDKVTEEILKNWESEVKKREHLGSLICKERFIPWN